MKRWHDANLRKCVGLIGWIGVLLILSTGCKTGKLDPGSEENQAACVVICTNVITSVARDYKERAPGPALGGPIEANVTAPTDEMLETCKTQCLRNINFGIGTCLREEQASTRALASFRSCMVSPSAKFVERP